MEEHDQSEWRQALAVARLAPTTGMVPVKCSTILALQAELERLSAELREGGELRERMGDLLRRTAVALRGPEPPLTSWSWHDLPERAAAAQAEERAALIGLAEKQCRAMKNEDPFEDAVRELCELRAREPRAARR